MIAYIYFIFVILVIISILNIDSIIYVIICYKRRNNLYYFEYKINNIVYTTGVIDDLIARSFLRAVKINLTIKIVEYCVCSSTNCNIINKFYENIDHRRDLMIDDYNKNIDEYQQFKLNPDFYYYAISLDNDNNFTLRDKFLDRNLIYYFVSYKTFLKQSKNTADYDPLPKFLYDGLRIELKKRRCSIDYILKNNYSYIKNCIDNKFYEF